MRTVFVTLLLLALGGFGCKGPTPQEKFHAKVSKLAPADAFEEGKALIAKKKWDKGRKYLSWIYENYPGEEISREALLRLADSFYLQGSDEALIEALYRYRDYQSRFPNRPEIDYVMMRIGDSLLGQSGKPDRDQEKTKKAVLQYQELLRLYPDTPRRGEVIDKIKTARQLLAGHELEVGKFYVRRGFSKAAIGRLVDLLEDFPDFEGTDEALYWILKAHRARGLHEEGKFYKSRLVTEYPDSDWAEKGDKLWSRFTREVAKNNEKKARTGDDEASEEETSTS